jgi:hypothetical protein
LRIREICKRRLWKRSDSLYASSAKGTCKEGSFTGDPEGYITGRLGKRASFSIGDPSGNLEGGSFIADLERCNLVLQETGLS